MGQSCRLGGQPQPTCGRNENSCTAPQLSAPAVAAAVFPSPALPGPRPYMHEADSMQSPDSRSEGVRCQVAHIQYLTTNSLSEGVGSSQVREYVRRLPDFGHSVDVLSFENSIRSTTECLNIDWTPRAFGTHGTWSALRRLSILTATAHRARRTIIHARSDIPALAAMLGRADVWIWDMRAFWRDQRIVMGHLRERSAAARFMEGVERKAAADSSAIICLAEAAIPVLRERFGAEVGKKVTVIPTAVDTKKFQPDGRPSRQATNLLLLGTFNSFYDGSAIARFIKAANELEPVRVTWVGAGHSPWTGRLSPWIHEFVPTVPLQTIPEVINRSDVGLVICRQNVGPSLRAAMPTKIAEFLACGKPVVVSSGLGDMDRLVSEYGCGVVIHGNSAIEIASAAERLQRLIADPDLVERCRSCATEWFDLDRNVARLSALYERLEAR